MAFEVSWHPIDESLIRTRIVPYLKGDGTLDDLALLAASEHGVRYQAKTVAVGLNEFYKVWQVALQDAKKNKKLGPPSAAPVAEPLPGFNADVHTYGRPYFITTDSVEVTQTYLRYRAANLANVDGLLQSQLDRWKFDLASLNMKPPPETTPTEVLSELDFLKANFAKLKTNGTVTFPDGETTDAEGLFLTQMPATVIRFASQLTPGWMARGPLWFTMYLDEAKLLDAVPVQTAGTLFENILRDNPEWEEAFSPTILHNYMLGGYVAAAAVPEFRKLWLEREAELIAPWIADKDEARGRHGYMMIAETLAVCEHLGFGILEASEMYSASLGMLN